MEDGFDIDDKTYELHLARIESSRRENMIKELEEREKILKENEETSQLFLDYSFSLYSPFCFSLGYISVCKSATCSVNFDILEKKAQEMIVQFLMDADRDAIFEAIALFQSRIDSLLSGLALTESSLTENSIVDGLLILLISAQA